MLSLSMLELLGLGHELPEDWRQLTRKYPDDYPLLFRWPEFVHLPPPELVGRFLVPLEWHASSASLLVTPWPVSVPSGHAPERRVLPANLLPYFRLYREVPGMRVPQPLQVDHRHVQSVMRRTG